MDDRDHLKQQASHLVSTLEKIVGTSRRPLVGIGYKNENGPLQYIVYLRTAHNLSELPDTFKGIPVSYQVAGDIHALNTST